MAAIASFTFFPGGTTLCAVSTSPTRSRATTITISFTFLTTGATFTTAFSGASARTLTLTLPTAATFAVPFPATLAVTLTTVDFRAVFKSVAFGGCLGGVQLLRVLLCVLFARIGWFFLAQACEAFQP